MSLLVLACILEHDKTNALPNLDTSNERYWETIHPQKGQSRKYHLEPKALKSHSALVR